MRLTALLCLSSLGALASPLDLFGYTPRGTAMAGALTAGGDALTGAFYNPALLPLQQKTELAFGLSDTLPALHVDRELASSALATALPDSAPRFEIGAVIPIRGKVFLGVAGSFPVNRLLRLENLDAARPQFLLYQSKPQRFHLSLEAGVRLLPKLSLGAGLLVSQSQSGSYRFGLDVADRVVTTRESHVDAVFSPSFTLGALYDLGDSLRLGFSWRSPQSAHTDVPTIFDLQGLGTLQISTASTSLYWPHVLSGGAAFRTAELLLTAQLDLQLWSLASSEEVQFTILPTGQVLTDSGLSDLLGFDAEPRPAGLHTVLIPRAAVEYKGLYRAGIAYKPAITSDQTGLSSYLDNATLTLGAGASLPLGEGLSVEAALSASVLFERRMQKASAQSPTGNASFGGALISGSAMIHYTY